MSITVSEAEQKVFNTLLGINEKYALGLTLRVAGGWVRDKLLGSESDDIDISLDKMTGKEFCTYIRKEIDVNVHIIEQNHDQCKHLEVAGVKLHDLEIDLLHLRSEEYGDSRIPEIEIGSPQEDAMRRDLTINALFYNINTGEVEDYTGTGLEDLENKIIRTPSDIVLTLMDDPLRVMRAVRFASRLKFTLDPEIVSTVRNNNDVRSALEQKVSGERIITEIEKTIKCDAVSAIKIFTEMNIIREILGITVSSETLLEMCDSYLKNFGQAMDMVTFMSFIFISNNDYNALEELKITKREKKDIHRVLDITEEVMTNLMNGDDSDHGGVVYRLGNEELVDVHLKIMASAMLDDDEYGRYKEIIDSFRWTIGMRPLINGHEVQDIFRVKGKKIRTVLNDVIKFQMDNKDCKKSDVVEAMRAIHL